MPKDSALLSVHQTGEAGEEVLAEKGASAVDTFGGKVFVGWDPEAHVTGFGPAAYFIEFLKTNGLWERWVADCPLHYTSPNAPPKQDILGTVMLSVLAGHKRYAHISTVRSDSVLPQLLGMQRVRSEDAIRRAFQHGEEEAYTVWTRQQLAATYQPLLSEPWILDMDATEKPLYGIRRRPCWGTIPASLVDPRMCTTVILSRPFAWCWRWRCRPGITLPPSMRSQDSGPSYMRARGINGRICCEVISVGAPSG